MTAPRRGLDWGLLLRWVLNSAVGWAVGGALVIGLSTLIPSALYRNVDWTVAAVLGTLVAGVIGGIMLGIGQWLVLRNRLRLAGWWILATGPGWALGWLVGRQILQTWDRILCGGGPVQGSAATWNAAAAWKYTSCISGGYAVGGALLGALLGLSQWLVLRRGTRRAGRWVTTSAAGAALGWLLALGGFIAAATAFASWSTGELVGMTLGWVAGGVAMAAITGLTLNKLILVEQTEVVEPP